MVNDGNNFDQGIVGEFPFDDIEIRQGGPWEISIDERNLVFIDEFEQAFAKDTVVY